MMNKPVDESLGLDQTLESNDFGLSQSNFDQSYMSGAKESTRHARANSKRLMGSVAEDSLKEEDIEYSDDFE